MGARTGAREHPPCARVKEAQVSLAPHRPEAKREAQRLVGKPPHHPCAPHPLWMRGGAQAGEEAPRDGASVVEAGAAEVGAHLDADRGIETTLTRDGHAGVFRGTAESRLGLMRGRVGHARAGGAYRHVRRSLRARWRRRLRWACI